MIGIETYSKGIYLYKGREIIEDIPENQSRLKTLTPGGGEGREEARRRTITGGILQEHNGSGNGRDLQLRFDALASHDITFVNIIQTAKVSGLEVFPVPYILTNCHNSLCAVGGTINEDDHLFGLSAAKRCGGVYVPPHLGVIHTYMREAFAGCGKMILGSDSHTRYGSLGTLGVGEGGGEIVKQLLSQTYDLASPPVIAVHLSGKPRPGVGPQDIALALIGALFPEGFAKNKVLEFVGKGIASLPADYRAGIDVMTTETACWSSVWETDEVTEGFLAAHVRGGDYRRLFPGDLAYYDGLVRVNLSEIGPMIALPFHPSNACPLADLLARPREILRQAEEEGEALIEAEHPGLHLHLADRVDGKGRIRVDQGIIAGCAGGTFDNLCAVSSILGGQGCPGGPGNEGFSLSLYPGSQPVLLELARNGVLAGLTGAGAVTRTAFCGPCFGAGDTPGNDCLSIRHTTRNFPNREGSKPGQGQIAGVCLMDARSIAATAKNGGWLASAEDLGWEEHPLPYRFDPAPYQNRVYDGRGRPYQTAPLRYGPNITDWPPLESLGEHLLLKIVSFITDPVTTTDELIPSGETSSYRSNPLGLAEFTLSRKDPGYVPRAKAVRRAAAAMAAVLEGLPGAAPGEGTMEAVVEKAGEELPELKGVLQAVQALPGMAAPGRLELGSAIYARRPGDGSAREQAASCQRVLGGLANFAGDYATKRYRSNLINWGMLPFTLEGEPPFGNGDWVFLPGIAGKVREGAPLLEAWVIAGGQARPFTLRAPELGPRERELILAGCLINVNRNRIEKAGDSYRN